MQRLVRCVFSRSLSSQTSSASTLCKLQWSLQGKDQVVQGGVIAAFTFTLNCRKYQLIPVATPLCCSGGAGLPTLALLGCGMGKAGGRERARGGREEGERRARGGVPVAEQVGVQVGGSWGSVRGRGRREEEEERRRRREEEEEEEEEEGRDKKEREREARGKRKERGGGAAACDFKYCTVPASEVIPRWWVRWSQGDGTRRGRVGRAGDLPTRQRL